VRDRMKPNRDIREAIKEAGILTWEVANFLKIHETTLYRRLRKEFSDQEKKRILGVIESLKVAD
jgi:DNA-binding NtrC family response regulator